MIVIKRADGGVSVMHLVEGVDVQAEIEKWKTQAPGQYVSHAVVAEIPTERAFRDAWVVSDGKVEHDMARCRDIHRQRIRAARQSLLARLDVEYQRADEVNDAAAKKSVAARKQVLRDATDDPRIDAARTPDELKKAWPL